MATSKKTPAKATGAKKPTDHQKKASSAADFKKRKYGTFELPSGLVAELKNPGGLRVFMGTGSIPNSLMPIVNNAVEGGVKPKTEDLQASSVDPETISDMMAMMDNIAVTCFVNPRVHAVPEDNDDRDEELLYADDIEDEDKMFIFRWVSGGTSDVERFRKEQASDVASLAG
jgi:hypothetical protein